MLCFANVITYSLSQQKKKKEKKKKYAMCNASIKIVKSRGDPASMAESINITSHYPPKVFQI